jgi:hypothetical protein
MNPNNQSQNQTLLDAVFRRGVLVATSVRYWRGHKRLIPRDALQAFALIESRVLATVEGSSFPLLGGIARFVPNPRLG